MPVVTEMFVITDILPWGYKIELIFCNNYGHFLTGKKTSVKNYGHLSVNVFIIQATLGVPSSKEFKNDSASMFTIKIHLEWKTQNWGSTNLSYFQNNQTE